MEEWIGMIAIQPPAYFPPLAYMALCAQVDHFVLADTFRYRTETFQNRSKLRNAQGGHWITIPLFGHPEGRPLCDVDIETGGRWLEKHWRSFLYDYRTTMYFDFYRDQFQPFFETTWEALADCTCRSVRLQASLLGLDTTITRATALTGAPASRAAIVETLADGQSLDEDEPLVVPAGEPPAEELKMPVQAFEYEHPTYRQNFEGFEPGMTALDLVFNYGREAPRRLMQGRAG